MKNYYGTETDLKRSNYKFSFNGLTYYFSTPKNVERFSKGLHEYIEQEQIKFQNRYKTTIKLKTFLIIEYYRKIEKRGFRIYDELSKKEITENVKFINSILEY